MAELHKIKKYMESHKWTIVFWLFIALLAYGSKLFFYANQFDTVGMTADYDSICDWWTAIGRFSLVATKRIVENGFLNIWFSNFLSVIMLVISAFSWCYLIEEHSVWIKIRYSWVFGALFMTTPIMAEQVSFSLQNWEVMCGYTIVALALHLFFKGYSKGGGKRNYLISAILLVWCEGLYQNFIAIFVLGFFMILLLKLDLFNTTKKVMAVCLSFGAITIISLAGYFVINKIVQTISGIGSSSYLSENFYWISRPFGECIRDILYYIKELIFANNSFYASWIYGGVFILFLLFCFMQGGNKILDLSIRILIIASPFYFVILFGGAVLQRIQIVLPVAFAFCGWYIVERTCSLEKRARKIIVPLLVIIVVLRHSQLMSQAFYSDYSSYNSDIQLAEQIMEGIEYEFPNGNSNRVIFINSNNGVKVIPDKVHEENIGSSIFNLGWATDAAQQFRIEYFLMNMGYPIERMSGEEYDHFKRIDYTQQKGAEYRYFVLYFLEGTNVVYFK